MWATMPKLLHQPYLEMWPDERVGAILYGENNPESSPPGTGLFFGSFSESTWRPADKSTSFQAVHLISQSLDFSGNLFSGTPIKIWLGDRYSVRLDRIDHTTFNGDEFIAGVVLGLINIGGSTTQYLKFSVRDYDQPLVEHVLRGSQWNQNTSFLHPFPDFQIACGYYFNETGAWIYANAGVMRNRFSTASNVPVAPAGGIAIPSIPCFGAGTVQIKTQVESADIYGELRIEGPIVRVPLIAAHYGPFFSDAPYVPDSTTAKRERQGSTIGSLRNFANNFDQPMPPGLRVLGNEFPAPKPQTTARVDCAGHYDIFTHTSHRSGLNVDFSQSRYVSSVAGRIESETAYVKNDLTAASNLSPVHSENELLSRLRVVMASGKILGSDSTAYTLPQVEWSSAASLEANNEYTAYNSDPIIGTGFLLGNAVTRSFPRQSVLVEISRYDIIENHMSSTLDGVILTTQFSVHIVAFIRDDQASGQTAAQAAVKRFQGFKLLTAGDVASLFAGEIVEIPGRTSTLNVNAKADDAFSIQAIGPA